MMSVQTAVYVLLIICACHPVNPKPGAERPRIPRSYLTWIETLQGNLFYPSSSWRISVDVKIDRSGTNQCSPLKVYCWEDSLSEGVTEGSTLFEGSELSDSLEPPVKSCSSRQCIYDSCNVSSVPSLSSSELDSIQYLKPETQPVNSNNSPLILTEYSKQNCGVHLENGRISYTDVHFDILCSPIRSRLLLKFKELENQNIEGFTFSFTVEKGIMRGNSTEFLKISNLEKQTNVTYSFGPDNTIEYQLISSLFTGREAITVQFPVNVTILITKNGLITLFNGEVWKNSTLFQKSENVTVSLGSLDFRGTFYNLKLYTTVASFVEILSKEKGVAVPEHIQRADCKCPREYPDWFFEVKPEIDDNITAFYHSTQCGDGIGTKQFQRATRSNEPISIFDTIGWMSDFTDLADVYISFPQPILVYSLEMGLMSFPEKLDVYMISGDKHHLLVQVTDDCMEKYNIPAYEMPQIFPPAKRRRDVANQRQIRCFDWSDIATTTQVIIPILLPNDESFMYSQDLSGTKLQLKLQGHYGTYHPRYQWFGINSLRILGRPDCGGSSYTDILPGDSIIDIANYYNIKTQKYECNCPNGITGDRCETCVSNSSVPRYRMDSGICANCQCTDFSKTKQCDMDTGQCPCITSEFSGDDTFIDRQCNWFISNIHPLYGPIAGGTAITITGGYLISQNYTSRPRVTMEMPVDVRVISGTSVAVTTPSYRTENSSVTIYIEVNTEGNIGPRIKRYVFKYLPNPVIEVISRRRTFLSGGTNVTVTGRFLDSVEEPIMIIYMRLQGKIITTFNSTCSLINGTMMMCPTPRMIEVVQKVERQLEIGGIASELERHSTSSTPMDSRMLRRDRRQTSAEAGSELKNLEFTAGFLFDGLHEFKDLLLSTNTKLKDQAAISVFVDPTIYEFESPGVLEFKAEDDVLLKIKGEGLTRGADSDDYHVIVGLGTCVVTQLTLNQLTCRPPVVSPTISENNFHTYKGKRIPNVQVSVGNLKVHVGYIYYKTNIWNDNEGFRGGISFLIALVLLLLILIPVLIYVHKRREKYKVLQYQRNPDSTRYIIQDNHIVIEPFLGKKISDDLLHRVNSSKIPKEKLSIGEALGKGFFGKVYKGQLVMKNGNLKTVAIKTFKDDHEMGIDDLENFLREATIMIDFKHENVLSLIGIVWQEGERPLVVLPYMENGDLCSMLQKPSQEYVLGDMLHFALQISNGMSYLADQKFVHRDLAARNCMVSAEYMVKIADFGLSRDVYEKDYYRMDQKNKPLPVKWMAIESLKEGVYNTKSDVWSFGITMWELLTRGNTPYPGITNNYVKEYVAEGKRLDQPTACPDVIFQLMLGCWKENPEERPKFGDISNFLAEVLELSSPKATYERLYTKDIPHNYTSMYQSDQSENYLLPTTYDYV